MNEKKKVKEIVLGIIKGKLEAKKKSEEIFLRRWKKMTEEKPVYIEMKNKLELECCCHGHRLYLEKEDDGTLYVDICEKKRGRPKWVEVVLWKDDIEKIIEFLK